MINLQPCSSGQIFPYLPSEYAPKILTYLNSKTLRQFEQVAKTCYEVTEPIWSEFKQQDRVNFEWRIYKGKKQPHKHSYRLSQGLIRFIEHYYPRAGTNKSISREDTRKFQALMNDSPDFRAFVRIHFPKEADLEISHAYKKRDEERLEKLNQVHEGGELLLYALFKATQLSSKQVTKDNLYNYFKQAIDHGASCVSYLGVRILEKKISFNWHMNLAIFAAYKEDVRGLEELIQDDLSQYKSNLSYVEKLYQFYPAPQVCYLLAQWYADPLSAEKFILEAIKSYENNVPSKVWRLAAEIESKLKQWDQVALFRKKIVTSYKNKRVPLDDLWKAGLIYTQLKQEKEADIFFAQALINYKEFEAKFLFDAALVKIKLKQWKEADDLLRQAQLKYGNNASSIFLGHAIIVKLHLKQGQSAKELLSQVLNKEGNKNLSFSLLKIAAQVHDILEEWSQADHYYRQILINKENKVSGRVLARAAWVKHNLGQWSQSINLYNKVLAYYGKNISETILKRARFVNQTWEQTEQFNLLDKQDFS